MLLTDKVIASISCSTTFMSDNQQLFAYLGTLKPSFLDFLLLSGLESSSFHNVYVQLLEREKEEFPPFMPRSSPYLRSIKKFQGTVNQDIIYSL